MAQPAYFSNTLRSDAQDGELVYTDQVFDQDWVSEGKKLKQSDINKKLRIILEGADADSNLLLNTFDKIKDFLDDVEGAESLVDLLDSKQDRLTVVINEDNEHNTAAEWNASNNTLTIKAPRTIINKLTEDNASTVDEGIISRSDYNDFKSSSIKINKHTADLENRTDGKYHIPPINNNSRGKALKVNDSGNLEWGEVASAMPEQGNDGATYVPSVSAEGVLSWSKITNISDTPNAIDPVNIKGVDGEPGEPGEQGASAFELWQSLEGNENKTLADFWLFLGAASDSSLAAQVSENTKNIEKLLYVPINISSFTLGTSVFEKGSTVSSLVFNWSINKTPGSLKIDTTVITPTLKTYTMNGLSLTANKTFTLTAVDSQTDPSTNNKKTVTKTASISFVNGIYYGVSTKSSGITNADVLGFTKKLQSSRTTSFTTNGVSNRDYIYFAIPSSYGTPTFTVGGFAGGFESPVSLSFTNSSGFTENYNIYRSTNPVGKATVNVT